MLPNTNSITDQISSAAGLSSGGAGYQGVLNSLTDSKQFIGAGGLAVDGFFFNFPKSDLKNFMRQYPYEFTIHDGTKPLLRFTLPLAPSAISIDVPSATSTTVTMRGITEEHNGAPLRRISISGTSGIRPQAGFDAGQGGGTVDEALGQYLFKNTIQGISRVKSSFNNLKESADKIVQGVTGKAKISLDTPLNTKWDEVNNDTTGYKIIHQLQRFFDFYLAAKKSLKNKQNLYLSFNMYKDDQYYDCTLNGYNVRKAAGSLEYTYNIALTAWRRRESSIVKPTPAPDAIRFGSPENFVNPFAAITETLRNARGVIGSVYGVLKGINNDIDAAILGPINQAVLLAGEISNAKYVASDFITGIDATIAKAMKASIKDAFTGDKMTREMSSLKDALKKKNIQDSPSPIEATVYRQENSGKGDDSVDFLTDTPETLDIIFNPAQENIDIFDNVNTDSLNLPEEAQQSFNLAIAEASRMTDKDIETIRQGVDDYAATISEAFGGGSTTYNRINNKETPSVDKEISVKNIEILSAFNDMSIALDDLSSRLRQQRKDISKDYAKYYAEYARTQGIDFADNTSKFYVPFPYGASLDSLAYQYLGDARRWIEIAALNVLREPYIDEDGFYKDLKVSGSGNNITLSDSENLYIGQVILIESDVVRSEQRKIKEIDEISETETLITVDGDPDLSKFVVIDNAKIKAFLPHTVNSNMMIAIPSSVPVNVPGGLKINPGEDDLTTIALMAKSDFMLQISFNSPSDIAINGSDIKIASGMQNLTQAAYLKVLTKQEDLLNDPGFGNPISVGKSVADQSANQILAALNETFLLDPRFSNIIAGRVKIEGAAAAIDLVVGVSGTEVFLPFTAEIPVR